MNKHEIKQAMAVEAKQLGFELVYADLRSGCFYVKSGAVVRMGRVWRNIARLDIAAQVNAICQYGDRLDTMSGSVYFVK
jgi:hypothetical protein